MKKCNDNSVVNDHSYAALLPKLVQRARPVSLLGMMGAGKSTVARQLSVLTGLGYIDSDSAIEQALGTSIAECFATHGEELFRQTELQVITRAIDRGGVFLSLGGGAFMNDQLRALLLEKTDCVFLDIPPEILWSRVKNKLSKRPMLNTDNPRATFNQLYQQRHSIYSQAPIHVSSDTNNVMETVLMMKNQLWTHFESETT